MDEIEQTEKITRSIYLKILAGLRVIGGIFVIIYSNGLLIFGIVGFLVSLFIANAIWNQKKWVRTFYAYIVIPFSTIYVLYLFSTGKPGGVGTIIELIIIVALLSKCWNEFK